MRKLSHVYIGRLAEKDACQFLQKQGLTLQKKNFCSRHGEIDLIMQDKNYLVFVEVKMRTYDSHGSVLEVVTRQKQSRLIHAAKVYLLKEKKYDTALCRFDVVGITPHKTRKNQREIIWIKNAFMQ